MVLSPHLFNELQISIKKNKPPSSTVNGKQAAWIAGGLNFHTKFPGRLRYAEPQVCVRSGTFFFLQTFLWVIWAPG